MDSLVIYFFAFICSSIMAGIYQKIRGNKIIWIALISLPVFLLQAFRYYVGTDYKAYISLYYSISLGPNDFYFKRYLREPLYLLQNIITKIIFDDYTGLFIITSLVECILIFYIIDYYKDKISMSLAYFLYYCISFPHFLNAERQGVAAVLVWLSYRFLEEKKLVKFMICIILAAMMHNTAIIMISLLVAYYLTKTKVKVKDNNVRNYFLMCLAIVVVINFRSLFDLLSSLIKPLEKYSIYIYSGWKGMSLGFVIPYLLVLPFLLLDFFRRNKIFQKKELLYIYYLGCIVIIISAIVDYGNRVLLYTDFSCILLICFACKELVKESKVNWLIKPIYSILGIVYFVSMYYVVGCDEIFPYNSLLFK